MSSSLTEEQLASYKTNKFDGPGIVISAKRKRQERRTRLKFTMVAILSDQPERDVGSLYADFVKLGSSHLRWRSLARELLTQLFPFETQEQHERRFREKFSPRKVTQLTINL